MNIEDTDVRPLVGLHHIYGGQYVKINCTHNECHNNLGNKERGHTLHKLPGLSSFFEESMTLY